ncbi:hypothetical protein D3C78_1852260 [compost metagenome]
MIAEVFVALVLLLVDLQDSLDDMIFAGGAEQAAEVAVEFVASALGADCSAGGAGFGGFGVFGVDAIAGLG